MSQPKADKIRIDDVGNKYSGADVEAALQEIGAGTTLDARYLLLDQTTHQHVINGAPRFDGEVALDTPAIIIKSGQKLIFDGA